ncbi:MAG: S-methyl-5-thioribose-1-phosphate isomerase [Verrucomicrobiota bacterium]
MLVNGKPTRTIWLEEDGWSVRVIDQRRLPHHFETLRLTTPGDAADAIREMVVRGAPLIGATAAYGICLALREDACNVALEQAIAELQATRPTAVNLRWALETMRDHLLPLPPGERAAAAYARARQLCEDDVATNAAIGEHGMEVFRQIAEQREAAGRPVTRTNPLHVLTHCNAGWLGCVDWGTATAPMHLAAREGFPLHVWVDETRPRNQGASLTTWELGQSGVDHTLIVDNAGGHLMQHGRVDLVLVGTDRVTATGDVCNKIGTYLKALAAQDNGVPFYVGLPSSTIDWSVRDGVKEIPIEERAAREVTHLSGLIEAPEPTNSPYDSPLAAQAFAHEVGEVEPADSAAALLAEAEGTTHEVRLCPAGTNASNYGFDVTPARLVTGLITERGVVAADEEALAKRFGK